MPMKHLIKIFEYNEVSDFEKIKDIFLDYIENDPDSCDLFEDDDPSSNLTFTQFTLTPSNNICKEASSINDIDEIIKNSLEINDLLLKLKSTLKRIDYLGYNWSLSFVDVQNIVVNIFYTKLKLEQVLFDRVLIKKYFKEVYNIDVLAQDMHQQGAGTYNQTNLSIYRIYISENLTNESEVIKDLQKINKTRLGSIDSVTIDNGKLIIIKVRR